MEEVEVELKHQRTEDTSQEQAGDSVPDRGEAPKFGGAWGGEEGDEALK